MDSSYGGFATPFSVIIPEMSSGDVISKAGSPITTSRFKMNDVIPKMVWA